MARKALTQDRLIDAMLALAERQGLAETGLSDIAREAGASLAELYRLAGSKAELIAAFLRRTDLAVLEEPPEEAESARERLFELLMRRFEILAPHREALRVLVREARRHPDFYLPLAPAALRSARMMLEAARLSSEGLRGLMRLRALVSLYTRVVPVWLDDDPSDLAKTMAALDRGLRESRFFA